MAFFQDRALSEVELVHGEVALEEILDHEPLRDGQLLRQETAEHTVRGIAEAQVEARRLILPGFDRGLGGDDPIMDQRADLLVSQDSAIALTRPAFGSRFAHETNAPCAT